MNFGLEPYMLINSITPTRFQQVARGPVTSNLLLYAKVNRKMHGQPFKQREMLITSLCSVSNQILCQPVSSYLLTASVDEDILQLNT